MTEKIETVYNQINRTAVFESVSRRLTQKLSIMVSLVYLVSYGKAVI